MDSRRHITYHILVDTTHHGLACILVAAEGAGEDKRLLQDMVELIRISRVRAPQLPIFALGEQVTIENAPAEAMADLNQLRGILYLFEDTVPFLARQVARAARNYLDGLLPPFFKALVQHTADSNYSWHTPGHGGGVAYRKSPVGQAFHQFFGENTLRSDLSVSVPELGSLLDHTGPLAAAEERAARNFGADHSVSNQAKILRRAFDLGITHFDLANNYGPPPGSAERCRIRPAGIPGGQLQPPDRVGRGPGPPMPSRARG